MNKKPIRLVTFSVLTLIIGSLLFLTWWQVKAAQRRQALFDAIRADNAPQVLALLHAGVDPNLRQPTPHPFSWIPQPNSDRSNADAPTPLLTALYLIDHPSNRSIMIRYNPNPDPVIIRALLEAGADANATDQAMASPIIFAVSSGKTEVVDLLLKHGAKVNQKDMQGIPLLIAASQGRVKMMQYLLAQGADIDAVSFQGENALISTIRYARDPKAVKLLLDHHIKINVRDRSGKTALFYAQRPSPGLAPAQTRHLPEVIALLKKLGAQ